MATQAHYSVKDLLVEMRALVQGGQAVQYKGHVITRLEDMPTRLQLCADNVAELREYLADISEEMSRLKRDAEAVKVRIEEAIKAQSEADKAKPAE